MYPPWRELTRLLTNWRLSIQEGTFRSDPLQMLSNQFWSGQQSCELPPGGIHTPFGLGVLLKHEMQVTSGSLDWQEKARECLQSHTVVICIGTIALCTLQWTVILTTALRGVTKLYNYHLRYSTAYSSGPIINWELLDLR